MLIQRSLAAEFQTGVRPDSAGAASHQYLSIHARVCKFRPQTLAARRDRLEGLQTPREVSGRHDLPHAQRQQVFLISCDEEISARANECLKHGNVLGVGREN